MHDELELFTRAGLTPYEMLRAVTVNPAKVLGASDDAGTVEPGKYADLLLVNDNPLEGLGTLRRPAGVMVRGRYAARAELDRLLEPFVSN